MKGTRERLNVAALLVEFLMVVAGILVALALDDWNAGRKDAQLEVQYLHDLVEDLWQDSAEIESTRRSALARALAAGRLLSSAGDAPPSLRSTPTDLSDTVLVNVRPGTEIETTLAISVLDGTTAAFDELRGSGNLRVLRDRAVVRLLSQYYSRFASAQEGDLNRIRPDAQYLRAAVSRHGLTPGHGLSQARVREIIAGDEVLRGELRALHQMAQRQIVGLPALMTLNAQVRGAIGDRLAQMRAGE